uniref:Immunoglobulin domain protein n=1 Tax=Gongylonema pulchrum TaxID=637853 RepID=A0A183CUK9_9BILA
LYFSYNIKEDQTSYACSVALTSVQSGHYGPFFNFRLPELVSEEHFPPQIDSFQPQVFPETPQVGQTAFLECFAYARPAPTYRWSRIDGRPLSRKAALTMNGRLLRIEQLEIDDEGTYRCTALNEMGSDSAINGTIVLECLLANGSEAVEWFRNASPLNTLLLSAVDRARLIVGKNRLTITEALTEDSAVYQCIATNEIGSVSSSARLTVTDMKPRFDEFTMPRRIFTVPGAHLVRWLLSSATKVIPCIYESSPPGFAAWFRHGGEPIHASGRVRQQDALVHTLIFDYTESSDEGEYVCAVANRCGETQYSLQLSVIEKPSVSVLPKVKHLSTNADNVSVTENFERRGKRFSSQVKQKYELKLKVDAYQIEMRTRKNRWWQLLQVVPLDHDQPTVPYRIGHLQPNEEYQFRVKPRSGKEYGQPSRSTSWLKTLASPPLQPVAEIWWKKLNSHQILIEWNSNELNRCSGPNLRYLLSWCYPLRSDKKYEVAVYAENYVIHLNRSLDCEVMEITVVPVNDVGSGPAGYETVIHISDKEPTRYADEIDSRAINSTCVRFQWKWSNVTNCENFYGTKISCTDNANETISQSLSSRSTKWLLNGLQPSQTYLCLITAFDQYGRYGTARENVVRMKDAAPIRAPIITAHQIYCAQNNYSLVLHWTSVFGQQTGENKTDVFGYKVTVHVSETASRPAEFRIAESVLKNKDFPSVEIEGLKLMYQYTFRVWYFIIHQGTAGRVIYLAPLSEVSKLSTYEIKILAEMCKN